MIDVRAIQTRTWLQTGDGQLINLDPLVVGRNVEDVRGEMAQRLSLELRDTAVQAAGGQRSGQLAALGARLYHLRSEDRGETWLPWFEGEITDWEHDPERQVVSVTAHDPLFAFAAHEDQVKYREGTAGMDVLKDVFTAYGFQIGQVAGPTAKLPKIVDDGRQGDLVMRVLQHGLWMGEKAYLVRWLPGTPTTPGQVTVVAPGENARVYSFDQDANLLAATERQSTGEMVREVFLVGSLAEDADSGRPPIEQRISVPESDSRPKVGRRAIVKSADFDSPEAATKAAQTMLEKFREPERVRSVTVVDVPGALKGDLVRLRGGTLDGVFTIFTVSHDEDARTMALELGTRGSPLYQAQQFPEPAEAVADDASVVGCPKVAKVLAAARSGLGVPYVWGERSPSGWDCSGFMQWCYAQVGIEVGSWTGEQQELASNVVVPAPGRPGDLVFFAHNGVSEHVGMVSETPGQMYHASSPAVGTIMGPIQHGRPINSFRRPRGLCETPRPAQRTKAGGGGGDASGVTSQFGTPPAELAEWIAYYFPRDECRNAADVSYLESKWKRTARNGTAVPGFPGYVGPCGTRYTLPDGRSAVAEDSVSYFQINRCAHGMSVEELMDPQVNVSKAFDIWSQGGGYWGTSAKWLLSAQKLGIR